jgi:hypothetical protein
MPIPHILETTRRPFQISSVFYSSTASTLAYEYRLPLPTIPSLPLHGSGVGEFLNVDFQGD